MFKFSARARVTDATLRFASAYCTFRLQPATALVSFVIPSVRDPNRTAVSIVDTGRQFEVENCPRHLVDLLAGVRVGLHLSNQPLILAASVILENPFKLDNVVFLISAPAILDHQSIASAYLSLCPFIWISVVCACLVCCRNDCVQALSTECSWSSPSAHINWSLSEEKGGKLNQSQARQSKHSACHWISYRKLSAAHHIRSNRISVPIPLKRLYNKLHNPNPTMNSDEHGLVKLIE